MQNFWNLESQFSTDSPLAVILMKEEGETFIQYPECSAEKMIFERRKLTEELNRYVFEEAPGCRAVDAEMGIH